MTYPPSSSGYPPSQQPTTQFSAPTQQFGKPDQPSAQSPAATAAGPSKLPFILLAAVGGFLLVAALFTLGALAISRRVRAAAILRTVEDS